MNRLLARALFALFLATAATKASATSVDLVAGTGTLDWETAISVTAPAGNTVVTHPLFTVNRHSHEGWFLYLPLFDVLHEFTSFTIVSDGVSSDSLTSTFNFLGETFVLNLTYGITAAGPDGLPDLSWDGDLLRGLNPPSPFPILDARLFNVFDYNVGDDPLLDSATGSFVAGPGALIEIMGSGGIGGQRGAFSVDAWTADTLANVLGQITGPHNLNNTAAAGNYDMAGAFQWDYQLCASPTAHPDCTGPGGGGGGTFGGFGGFDANSDPGGGVPEPSAGVLLLVGILALRLRAARRA